MTEQTPAGAGRRKVISLGAGYQSVIIVKCLDCSNEFQTMELSKFSSDRLCSECWLLRESNNE